jgi:hypothetical protein
MSGASRAVLVGGAALAAFATLVAACDSPEPKKAPPPPPGFVMDEHAAGPTIFLRGRREGDRAVVDVVATYLPAMLHGAAFRLHWDPSKLALVEAHGSEAWSKQAIQLAKEGSPGELVVAWTEKGSASGFGATDETILGSIVFRVKTADRAALEFRPERSTVRDPKGAPIAVEWRGGQITPR